MNKKLDRYRNKIHNSRWNPLSFIKKEEEHTIQTADRHLTKEEAVTVAAVSLISALIYAFTKFMIFARWSTFPDNSYFFSWHPITPWVAILGSLLYIYCLNAKGVKYWLAYFPAFVGIFYCLIEACMIEAWLHPDDIEWFFQALFPNGLPDWLTGGRV